MVDSQDTTQQDAANQGDVALLSAILSNDLMHLDSEDLSDLLKMDSLKMETFSNIPSGNEDDAVASLYHLQPQQMVPAPATAPLHQVQQQLLLLTTTSSTSPPSEPVPSSLEHLNKAPTLDEYRDPAYDFDVSMNGETSGKSSWMFSSKLHKVFVKMNQPCTFNVAYRAVNAEQQRDLLLRVMLVCSAPEDLHQAISRCDNHRGNDRDSTRFSPDVIAHVMRCFNPSARYIGVEKGVAFQDRLAVVIPLGTSLQDLPSLAVSLEFVCQNSCRVINRRQTAIIFTLEDESGQILGKKSIHLKVCSCPKRDKQKEEEGLAPAAEKRKSDLEPTAPPGKKVAKLSTAHRNPSGGKMTFIKKEHPDSPPASVDDGKLTAGTVRGVPVQLTPQNSADLVEQTATTINVPMPSVSAAVKVAEYAFQVVAGDLVRSSNDEDRKHLAAYLTKIRRLQSKYEQFI